MLGNTIFVSYRRADSAPFALAAKLELQKRIEAIQVFLDSQRMKAGDHWPVETENTLRNSKAVIALIGPDWIGTTATGRRIDDEEDWVRKEIRIALAEKPSALFPVVLEGAALPSATVLPDDIKELCSLQAHRLRSASWNSDVDALVEVLCDRLGFHEKSSRLEFPTPHLSKLETIPIPWEVLEQQITKTLPNWHIEFSDHPDKLDYVRVEITREFRFTSFSKAMKFMQTVAEHAEEVNHHPRWMNLWRTVKVWLSTWDAGHRVTALDIQFARVLERKFRSLERR